jgi:hypothetical protein
MTEEKIFKIEEVTSNEKNDFLIKIRIGNTNTIVQVACPKPYKDRIIVAWAVTWLEDDLRSFMLLDAQSKATIYNNIQLAGVYMNISFKFIPDFERLIEHVPKIKFLSL